MFLTPSPDKVADFVAEYNIDTYGSFMPLVCKLCVYDENLLLQCMTKYDGIQMKVGDYLKYRKSTDLSEYDKEHLRRCVRLVG